MKKVLIANRGEIAIRVIRACQELGLKTVAIHSVADKDSLHAKLADESICIGPGPSAQSYLNIPSIMSAVELSGADSIHPGYGFLSENHEFARVCGEHHIKFIGPSPEHMKQLGNKVAARAVAAKAKVPMLPGSPSAVLHISEGIALAKKIGYPVIIKAAAGGGGRGMKVVYQESQLETQWQIAQSEAQSYFGNPQCFIEKYLQKPRHVEVQIIGDEYGQSTALGERDCSIQRRHQKLIEESPCPVLTDKERKKVCQIALNLVQQIKYHSLGTVEFLYENGEFYFMEVNTRAQVEHPVTEMVYNVDLIKEQIRIAQGEKLSKEILAAKPSGHALECRINAEDPVSFVPWPGLITDYHAPGGPGIRVDSMIYAGYRVPSLYDSLLAKLITYGSSRAECLARMDRALKEMKIEGIRTNIPFHLKVLKNPDFQKGDISTRFLDTF